MKEEFKVFVSILLKYDPEKVYYRNHAPDPQRHKFKRYINSDEHKWIRAQLERLNQGALQRDYYFGGVNAYVCITKTVTPKKLVELAKFLEAETPCKVYLIPRIKNPTGDAQFVIKMKVAFKAKFLKTREEYEAERRKREGEDYKKKRRKQ